jgi:DNA-binding PadR family transcriptional regulator
MFRSFKSVDKKGKEISIVSLYILASLSKEPQSGYGLLKNIRKKTNGLWVPSKGTIYPIINHMEEHKLIRVKKLGQRAKKVYDLTTEGRDLLHSVRKHDSVAMNKLRKMIDFFVEIFGKHISYYTDLFIEIKETIVCISPSKKKQVKKILEQCVASLEKLK